jgi:rod shape-determining protein MreB
MKKRIASLFPTVAIDLGSSRVRVWVKGAPEPAEEFSIVAVDQKGSLIAVGLAAQELQERNAKEVQFVTPIELGVIREEAAAQLLVQSALGRQKSLLQWRFPPIMMASIPVSATIVQQERTAQFLRSLGARETYLIAQPLAATIGAGIPLADTAGSVVVQLGAGRVEVAALTLGGITAAASCEFGGKSLIEQVRMGLRAQYGMEVSLSSAEAILHEIVLRTDEAQRMRISGKDVSTGSPKTITIDASSLVSDLQAIVDRYIKLIIDVLSQVPPAVTGDIVDRGILLSGGLAQLRGLSAYLSERLQLPCSVVEEPSLSTIKGITIALEHLEDFKSLTQY